MGQPNFVGGISGTWLADGSLLFIGSGNTMKAPPARGFRSGLYLWSEAKPTPQLVFEPDSDSTTPVSIAQSPDGKLVVELEENVAGAAKNDFFLLDAQTYKPTDRLTTSGDNQQPSWQ